MFTVKKVVYLFLFAIIANYAFAQTQGEDQISDQELQMFASAATEIQMLDRQSQQKMVKVIQDAGLNVQKYTAIQKAERNPQQEPNASKEELESYNAAKGQVMQMQKAVQTKMEKKIKESGLTVNRYKTISKKVQEDAKLREKVQKMMQPDSE